MRHSVNIRTKKLAVMFVFVFLVSSGGVLADANILDAVSKCQRHTETLRLKKIRNPAEDVNNIVSAIKSTCRLAMELTGDLKAKALVKTGYEQKLNGQDKLAEESFKLATESGYLKAFEALYFLFNSSGEGQRIASSESYIKRAADLGSPHAAEIYAYLHHQGRVRNLVAIASIEENLGYLWLSSALGQATATNMLSKVYSRKSSDRYDPKISEQLLYTAAKQGSVEAALVWSHQQLVSRKIVDRQEVDTLLKTAYVNSDPEYIPYIYKIYKKAGIDQMADRYLCLTQAFIHFGIEPSQEVAPGSVKLDPELKLAKFENCAN